MKNYFFSSESVMEGHPDKMCDQIADGILDEIIEKDPMARVACDVSVSTGLVMIYGQITTDCTVDIPQIARRIIKEIGYTDTDYGIDAQKCSVLTGIDHQSQDIASGVSASLECRSGSEDDMDILGAGDQGIMFGFACTETDEYMPLPINLANNLARRIAKMRKTGEVRYLRPDGKTQITVEYEGDKPKRVEAVVIACQHDESVKNEQIRRDMMELAVRKVIPENMLDDDTKLYVNSTGRFVTGGPEGDSGWTGKKIIVDTYGGFSRHGGGSFSGKDPTKVDRSAAYAARYAAKNIVAAGISDRCEIQLAYAIGVSKPISVMVQTFGTGIIDDAYIAKLIEQNFDFRPSAIINKFGLRRAIYHQVSCYGHFGRSDLDLPWEKLDKADILRKEAEKYF